MHIGLVRVRVIRVRVISVRVIRVRVSVSAVVGKISLSFPN